MSTIACDFLTIQTYQGIILASIAKPRLIEAPAIQAMHDVLAMHLARHARPSLVLDLHEVAALASAALGKFIALHKTIRAGKGRMAIAGLRPELKPLFTVTGLDKIFEFHPDAQQVMQAWKVGT